MKKYIKGFAIGFVLLVGGILFALSNQLGGWRTFIVSSASMEPAISTGSLIVTQYVHPTMLQKNDVITFIPPQRERMFITHRIVALSQKDTLTTFKTKGDNNKIDDMWILAGGAIVGKVMISIPYLGYLFSFTQTKVGILLFILLPGAYIIIDEISSVIKIMKQHKEKPTEQDISQLCLLFFFGIIVFSPQPTYALLSDSASLEQNTFTIALDASKNDCDKDSKKDNDDKNTDNIHDNNEKEYDRKESENEEKRNEDNNNFSKETFFEE